MNALITKALEEANVHHLFGFPQELISETEKRMVTWIVNYTARYTSPPTLERMELEFSTFVPVKSSDPLLDIYDRTLTKKRNHYARKYLISVQDKLKRGDDPLPFIEELHQTIRAGSGNVSRYTTYDRSAYLRRPTSVNYGIKMLDQKTGGIAEGDLVYLIGRLGTGKTTFALWLVSKWLQQEKRILMVSNENRADDVIAKIDSYIGGFNPIKKRTMEWSESDLHRLKTVSFIAQHTAGEVFIPNQPVKDVKEIQGMVYTYRPDLVVVDGIYLMQGAAGDSHWEKITSISRSLKQLAEGEGTPVLGLHQANRQAIGKRIEIEHIAYADALAQDADLVMAINAEDDGSHFVEAIKNRWGDKAGWGMFMNFFFDSMTVRVRDAKHAPKGGSL
jgi:KaiC/GvpD/RAD55 family RecA-like ATPase